LHALFSLPCFPLFVFCVHSLSLWAQTKTTRYLSNFFFHTQTKTVACKKNPFFRVSCSVLCSQCWLFSIWNVVVYYLWTKRCSGRIFWTCSNFHWVLHSKLLRTHNYQKRKRSSNQLHTLTVLLSLFLEMKRSNLCNDLMILISCGHHFNKRPNNNSL
jgi:hypothetical protein